MQVSAYGSAIPRTLLTFTFYLAVLVGLIFAVVGCDAPAAGTAGTGSDATVSPPDGAEPGSNPDAGNGGAVVASTVTGDDTYDSETYGNFRLVGRALNPGASTEWEFVVEPDEGAKVVATTLRFVWDFGDDRVYEGPDQTYKFSAGGSYVVTVTAFNSSNRVVFVLSLTIEVPPLPDGAPVADAGPDLTVAGGAAVCLDGSASLDPDGDPITYAWEELAGMAVALARDAAGSARFCFTAPKVDAEEQLVFLLSVSDGDHTTEDTVRVNVLAGPPPECAVDADCDDGLFCTGVETCAEGTCVAGTDPCPGKTCDEAGGSCADECSTSTATWQNFALDPQTGVFTVEYDALPLGSAVDGLTTLSAGPIASFADAAVLIRFNGSGTIDARNGAAYAAATTVAYTAGATYHFRVVVDVPAHTYSVYVTPPSSAEQLLGSNYAFRGEQAAITTLKYWGLWAVQSHQVCNFALAGDGNHAPVVSAGTDANITWPTNSFALNGTVTDDGLPNPPGTVTTQWSKTSGPGTVTFANAGAVDTTATFSVAGAYVLRLTADDGDLSASDEVTVTVAAAGAASLCVNPTALSFGSTLTSLTFEVWNCGAGALNYTVADNAAWLSVAPASGSSSGEHDTLTATVSRTSLSAGTYQAEITVTPSVGAAVSVLVAMTVGAAPTTNLTPIARWDVVPRQRVEQGATLKCGVVAFSKFGIQKVRFAVNAGTPVDVSAMTLNDQSNVYEYWFPLVASTFATDGPITVTATAYGNDGGTRTLPSLTFIVNGQGTLPRPQAWVAVTGGSDSTGMVNDPSRPFATIGKALDQVRAWMNAGGYGNKADGGIVRLRPGSHKMQNAGCWSGVTTTQEWVTLTCDPSSGGNRSNTFINQVTADGDYISSEWLKVEGLTLDLPVNNRPFFETSSSAVKAIWIHDCTVIGSDRYDLNPHPVGQNYWYKYFTNSALTNLRFAQGEGFSAQLARNLTITHIGEDAFADSPAIINVDLSDQDPGPPGGHEWHADAWQSPGITTSAPPPENYIVYNYRGTDLHYQAIFGRVKALASNNAFVNVFMEMRDPVRDYGSGNSGVGSWLGGTYDHLLLWNCTFIGTGTGHDFWWANESYTGTPQFRMTNASFRGNVFTRWLTTEGLSWTQASTVEFLDNHYITPTGALTYTPRRDRNLFHGRPGPRYRYGLARLRESLAHLATEQSHRRARGAGRY